MCVKATVQPSGAAGAYKNKKQDKKSRCSFHCPMHAPDQTLHTVNLVFVGPLFLIKKKILLLTLFLLVLSLSKKKIIIVQVLHVREKENSDIVQAKMKLNTSVKACLKAMPSRMVLECMLLKQLHRYVFMIHVGVVYQSRQHDAQTGSDHVDG